MYDARNIANEFIRLADESGKKLSNMKVQKLLFFAHARMLGLHGEPLLNQEFRAWRHGPVIPLVYHALKQYGPLYIRSPIPNVEPATIDSQAMSVILWCFRTYGHMSPLQLADLTHKEGTPWHGARRDGVIPNGAIQDYYEDGWSAETKVLLEQLNRDPDFVAKVKEGILQIERGECVTYSAADLEDLIARQS